ncbi:hypothetical protein RHMOL_Rhmol07G0057400 [Rhododendron molle]|uniref:Uncharacterized protein n=1 Tax=Rhododendron molle TaxID=49168 RepID=A0ACC0MXP2_RHOML|nr:hypothetical protein RHMOL_Rhmol07G0057400 [Rhododendron molle]
MPPCMLTWLHKQPQDINLYHFQVDPSLRGTHCFAIVKVSVLLIMFIFRPLWGLLALMVC